MTESVMLTTTEQISHGHVCPSDSEDCLDMEAQWEKEKQDLKSKVDELEEYKVKYEKEKKEKEKLEQQLAEMTASQSNVTLRLSRSNEVADKLRLDNKKKMEQIEKLQRDISYKDDRIRNLEIRASEVEKAELILETTRQNLESTVLQVKVRESEINRISKEYDDVCRKLETANQSIKELEAKIVDLRFQVRQELMKNDDIEKNLETIPQLHAEMREKEEEVKEAQRQTDERSALLVSARKTIRDYKDKIRELEQRVSMTNSLQEEVKLSRCEINTLKKLMSGKDYLVFQKSKALDLSKEVIEVLNDSSDQDQTEKIQQLIERLENATQQNSISSSQQQDSLSMHSESEFRSVSAPPPRQIRSSTPASQHQSRQMRGININTPPYTSENGHHHANSENSKQVFLQRLIGDMPDGRQRPVSAMARPSGKTHVNRTTSLREAQKIYQVKFQRNSLKDTDKQSASKKNSYKSEGKVNSKFQPSLDYGLGVEDKTNNNSINASSPQSPQETNFATWVTPRPHSGSDSESSVSELSDFDDTITSDQEEMLTHLSARQKDMVLSEIINVGDRILISIPQKPPRYGKKKVLKPLNYTGIVKYRGKLDKTKFDARIFVGVRMDEPVGDTDGMYKGKRYMYTPADQGKFFRIRDITSVLDIKSGRYVPSTVLMVHYINKHSIPQEPKENGHGEGS